MDTWRLLIDPPQTADVNMATDEAIAIAFSEQKVPPTLRFYQWCRPAFSIGRFQNLESAWINQLEKDPECSPFTLVRRMTGGRGLLHDRELTYALISSNKNPLFSSGIKGTYHTIAKGLLLALKMLGVDAEIYSPPKEKRTEGMRHPLCYEASSWYEITANGKKLIGSAQRRWPDHFLQHGSLILEKSILAKNTTVVKQPKWLGIPLSSKKQVTLSDLLPQLPSHEFLMQAMKSGFESALSTRLETGEISAYEQTWVERLVREKYDNAEWNLHRERK